MKFADSKATTTASAIVVLCVGVLVGLVMRLKLDLLGPISEPTMSLIGSVMGAFLGSAGSFLGAYFLWQRQAHYSEKILGQSIATILAGPYGGLDLINVFLTKSVIQSETESELSSADAQQLEIYAGALQRLVDDAKANLERVSHHLGALGSLRVLAFLDSEMLLDSTNEAMSDILSGNAVGLSRATHGGNALIADELMPEIARLHTELATAMERLGRA